MQSLIILEWLGLDGATKSGYYWCYEILFWIIGLALFGAIFWIIDNLKYNRKLSSGVTENKLLSQVHMDNERLRRGFI